MIHYRYTDTEVKKILDTLTINVDTREQKNKHILDYFRTKEVPFKLRTMKTGDYSAFIPKNEEFGIMRDIHLNACVERKNGVNELVGNLLKDNRTRFENELIRASKSPFVLIVEDVDGYGKILNGNYISQYDPKALLGSLKTFEVRYNFSIVFIDNIYSGNYIYHHLYYMAREYLRGGTI